MFCFFKGGSPQTFDGLPTSLYVAHSTQQGTIGSQVYIQFWSNNAPGLSGVRMHGTDLGDGCSLPCSSRKYIYIYILEPFDELLLLLTSC